MSGQHSPHLWSKGSILTLLFHSLTLSLGDCLPAKEEEGAAEPKKVREGQVSIDSQQERLEMWVRSEKWLST